MSAIKTLVTKIEEAGLWSKDVSLNRNDFLNVKGETSTNLYYVVDGSLRIFFEDDFDELTIRLGYTGNIITALDSFISNTPTSLYIQAIKKSHLMVISRNDFFHFIGQSQENLKLYIAILESFVLQQMEREVDILLYSPQERYNRVMARSPQLFQQIPAKYIAAYLRMSPETLSRLKKS